MEVEAMNWMWLMMPLETAVFLVFSAAMWLLVIRHAETGTDARGVESMIPARAAAQDTEDSAAREHRAA